MKRFTALLMATVIIMAFIPFSASAVADEYYAAVDTIENNTTYVMASTIYGATAPNAEKSEQFSVLNVPEVGANYTISPNYQNVYRNITKAGDYFAAPSGSMTAYEITAIDANCIDNNTNSTGYYLKHADSYLMLYQACNDIYKAYDSAYTYGSFKCSHYTYLTSPVLKFGTTKQVWFWDSTEKAFYTIYTSDTTSVGTKYTPSNTGSAAYEGYYINHSAYNSVKVRWDELLVEDPLYGNDIFYLMGRYNSNTQRYCEAYLPSIPTNNKDYDALTKLCYSHQYGFNGTALSAVQYGLRELNYSWQGVIGMQTAALTLYKKCAEPASSATVNICADGVKTNVRDGDTICLRNQSMGVLVSSTISNGTASFSGVKLGTYSILLYKNNTYTDPGQQIEVAFRDTNSKDVPVYRLTQSCTDIPAGKSPGTDISGWYFPNEWITLSITNTVYGADNKSVSIFSKWNYPVGSNVSGGKFQMPYKNVTVSADYNYYEPVISQLIDSEYVPVVYLESANALENYTTAPDNYFKLTLKRGTVDETQTGNISVSMPYGGNFSIECVNDPSASSFILGDVLKFNAYTGYTGSVFSYWTFYIKIAEGVELTKQIGVSMEVFPVGTEFTVTYNPGSLGSGTASTAKKSATVAKPLAGALFTRKGYIQTGWTDSDGGAQLYDLGDSYKKDADITLYPVWTYNCFTISGTVTTGSGNDGGTVYIEIYDFKGLVYSTSTTGDAYTISGVANGKDYVMLAYKENHVAEGYLINVADENVTQNICLWLKGDLNRDFSVDVLDCILCECAASGNLDPYSYVLDYYDIDGNGVCDTNDVQLVINYVLNRQ